MLFSMRARIATSAPSPREIVKEWEIVEEWVACPPPEELLKGLVTKVVRIIAGSISIVGIGRWLMGFVVHWIVGLLIEGVVLVERRPVQH